MSQEAWAMLGAGIAAVLIGIGLARPRLQAAEGWDKVLVLGAVFEAVALAAFSAEHFTAAHDLAPIVPRWLPFPLFWTYSVGTALLAAAVSLIAWRCVRWSATLLALFFFIIVATLDVRGIPTHLHDRMFWILTVRETSFASGAMVLAGAVWPSASKVRSVAIGLGRTIVALVMIFYGIEHLLFQRHVPGVPLEKLTPGWIPAPMVIAWLVGLVLVGGGIALLVPWTARIAGGTAGMVLVALTVVFYVPIFLTEMHTPLAVEGLNYIYDTLLFASTVMLAGLGSEGSAIRVPMDGDVVALTSR